MDIKQLKTIVSIVDHGSFQLAATALEMSVSNVSLHIRSLEQSVNSPLFDRSSRPPKLTESGHNFVIQARELLAQWNKFNESLIRNPNQGTLRIGSVHTAISGGVAVALGRLRKLDPDLFLQLQTALTPQLIKKVQNQTLDCAIVTKPPYPSMDVRFIEIAKEELSVVAHGQAIGDNFLEILTHNPYLRFNRQATLAAFIDDELQRRGIQVDATMEITTLDAVEALVKNGLGVSILPIGRGVRPLSRDLRVVPFHSPEVHRSLGIMVREDCPKMHLVELLVAELHRVYGSSEN
ncbi:MAG: LysR family transcriptional regulator [Gammaproteobacteria bacterium]|nr:LysR family transcriptional regulator [Gammaproteobacteria bacterium]NKB64372.1 LysR family transcriptional regulator [Gammaproteobacteria bacterium]